MPTDLELVAMTVEPLPAHARNAVMNRGGILWMKLTVTLRNPGDAEALVSPVPRRMHYDAAARRLTFELGEDMPFDAVAPSRLPKRNLPIPVPPRSEIALDIPFSSPITFIDIDAEGRRTQRQVRLDDDVDTIDCVVDVTAGPVDRRPTLTPDAEERRAARSASTTRLRATWSHPRRDAADPPRR